MRFTRLSRTVWFLSLVPLSLMTGLAPANATSTSSLFFNVNAGDSGSYSASSPSIWKDLAGSRNGTIVGNLSFDSNAGALVFPGGISSTNSNGYVDMGSGFNNFGAGITIEFEGHFGAVNQGWERIFDFGNGPESDNIWVGVLGEAWAPNELAIELWDGNVGKGRCISTGGVLSPSNTFAKWVITVGKDPNAAQGDPIKCRMYKNGVEIQTRVGPCWSSYNCSTAALGSTYDFLPRNVTRANNYIGRSNWGTDAAFNGAIKYVRIYTAALTQQDVTNNATTYTLTYSTTGFDSGTAPAAKTGNGLITLDGNTGNLAKAGHTFAGWATAANPSTVITGSYNLTADTTLQPVWTPNTYTVTYEEHGGSSVTDGSFTHGGSLTYPANPTRTGYSFQGWFTSDTGGTAQTASQVVAGNTSVTLHAQWTPVTYSITYDTHGGSAVVDGSYTIGSTVTLPSTPTRDGYTFAGWFTTDTGGTALGATYSPPGTGAITVHAQWTANTLTVTYDTHGGSIINSGTTTTGSTINASPGTPTRAGYTFNGWFTAATGGTAITFPYTHGQTGNFTLHAQWTPNTTAPPDSSNTNTPSTSNDTGAASPPSTTAPASSTVASPAIALEPETVAASQAAPTIAGPTIAGPRNVRGGKTVSWVANGFAPGESVVMKVGNSGTTKTLVADEDGRVRLTVKLSSATTNRSVTVRAVSRTASVSQTFEVTASTTNLPVSGSHVAATIFFAALSILIGHVMLSRHATEDVT